MVMSCVQSIGGPNDVVEIDEVLLVKRKYNRGRIPVGNYWVFGGVSRATKHRYITLSFKAKLTIHTSGFACGLRIERA